MRDPPLDTVVSLASHDLRTPIATISGFAKLLMRTDGLDERSVAFATMIDAAAAELSTLVDELGILARIEGGRYEPPLSDVDTLDLVTSANGKIAAEGAGETIRTDAGAVRRSLAALATTAVQHGGLDRVTWTVSGRDLRLARVTAEAGEILTAIDARDFGSLVARRVIEALGGTVELDGEALRVSL